MVLQPIMGATAEIVAERFEVSRDVQDEFAYNSQRKAEEAQVAGRFKEEIFPVTTQLYGGNGLGKEITLTEDTIIRKGTTLAGLQKLRAAFKIGGTVTAGNASPLTDGAGATVLMSEAKAAEMGVEPLAYFVDLQTVGVPPEVMGIGPVPAIRKLFEKHGLTDADIDIYEINEAFSAQAVYCVRELGMDPAKVNVNGGAIAMGHPLGVTGTRLTATIIYELRRRNAKRGVVSMCIGGGMGAAALIEIP